VVENALPLAVSPGSSPSTYLFTRLELRANLFRIPLH